MHRCGGRQTIPIGTHWNWCQNSGHQLFLWSLFCTVFFAETERHTILPVASCCSSIKLYSHFNYETHTSLHTIRHTLDHGSGVSVVFGGPEQRKREWLLQLLSVCTYWYQYKSRLMISPAGRSGSPSDQTRYGSTVHDSENTRGSRYTFTVHCSYCVEK